MPHISDQINRRSRSTIYRDADSSRGTVRACYGPATFCQLMRLVLADMKNAVCYFDDTFLHTSSSDQHIEGLRCLLSTLRKHSLTVNPEKLVIAKSSIEFWGHEVSASTMSPLSKRIGMILHLQPPVTKENRRSFVG
ncbi:Gag pol polyprotein [Elysia marginata]|uniref:Gag pol polyprotein n=1 Tax=Elysia marginata TaxID=1093978 RepID=A0AAV4GGQ7_9GAST|nr:Gag pol polyprotein [Elysia marginata]